MTAEELGVVAGLKGKIRQLESELKSREVDHKNCYILMSENVRLRRMVEAKDDELREAVKQLKEERKNLEEAKHALEKLQKWVELSGIEKPRYS